MGNPHWIEGSSFDEIYSHLLWWLSYDPQFVCAPRGQKINEIIATTLVLSNPRARLLNCKKRNTNYGFAVGEFLWYWSGRQDLKTMLYYNKRMKDYSDDGKTLNSAYGHRLRKMQFSPSNSDVGQTMSQWQACVETLKADPDSRRALMLINMPGDGVKAAMVGSKDVPCTLSLQFFIRNGRLDLHVHMRSNDVMWGLTYDLYSFTLFQECMLLELQKEEKFKELLLGKYYHTAGSLHLYEPHFEQAKEIVKEYGQPMDRQLDQQPLASLEDLETVLTAEQDLREGRGDQWAPAEFGSICSFKTGAWMIEQLIAHQQKRLEESLKKKG